MIDKLPGSGSSYDTFAYDVTLLQEFVRDDEKQTQRRRGGSLNRSNSRTSMFRGGGSISSRFRRGGSTGRYGRKGDVVVDSSVHSAGSLRGRTRNNNNNLSSSGRASGEPLRARKNFSVQGAGDFQQWKAGHL